MHHRLFQFCAHAALMQYGRCKPHPLLPLHVRGEVHQQYWQAGSTQASGQASPDQSLGMHIPRCTHADTGSTCIRVAVVGVGMRNPRDEWSSLG